MVEKSITVRAPINIALIKYWGKRNEELIIPYNDSISLTINDLYAETRIVVSNELKEDLVVINDAKIDLRNSRRFIPVFNKFRQLVFGSEAGPPFVSVNSTTNFATSSGLASSAAGFAAIAFGLGQIGQLDETSVARLARIGSGSACRSVLGGFVHWIVGSKTSSDEETTCRTIESSGDWSHLRSIIFEFKNSSKRVPSTEGMKRTVLTSELFEYRVNHVVPARIERLKYAIKTGNFGELGNIVMADSNQLHAVCLDSQPPLMYLNEHSWRLIDFIVNYNHQRGTTVAAYTFDAGPNCCVFIERPNIEDFLRAFNRAFNHLQKSNGVSSSIDECSSYTLPLERIFISSVGVGPVVLE